MDKQNLLIGSAIGVAVTPALIALPRNFSRNHTEALRMADDGGVLANTAGLVAIGLILGVTVIASRWSALTSVIPAAVLTALYVWNFVGYLTSPHVNNLEYIADTTQPLIIGMLLAAAVWQTRGDRLAVFRRISDRRQSATPST